MSLTCPRLVNVLLNFLNMSDWNIAPPKREYWSWCETNCQDAGWGPQSIAFSCLISVAKNGRYNYSIHGVILVYKPTYIWGSPSCGSFGTFESAWRSWPLPSWSSLGSPAQLPALNNHFMGIWHACVHMVNDRGYNRMQSYIISNTAQFVFVNLKHKP